MVWVAAMCNQLLAHHPIQAPSFEEGYGTRPIPIIWALTLDSITSMMDVTLHCRYHRSVEDTADLFPSIPGGVTNLTEGAWTWQSEEETGTAGPIKGNYAETEYDGSGYTVVLYGDRFLLKFHRESMEFDHSCDLLLVNNIADSDVIQVPYLSAGFILSQPRPSMAHLNTRTHTHMHRPHNHTKALAVLAELRELKWIDQGTRAVWIDFTVQCSQF
jgi:hypothetical protein